MIDYIKNSEFWAGKTTPDYFHCSVCKCSSGLIMTMQAFEGKSDTYGPVLYSLSYDNGTTWQDAAPVPALKTNMLANGLQEGIADVRPGYCAEAESVIAIGCNTFYGKKGCVKDTLTKKTLKQYPVYAVMDRHGVWSERKNLASDFFADCPSWRVACAQFLFLPDNKVLLPIYFENESGRFSVCSALCSFVDSNLKVEKISTILSSDINRGLIEPSLVVFKNKFFMTIRAEDDHGYFTSSHDGLSWSPVTPWRWNDGSSLKMSSTQQHWLSNGGSLYLLYTRESSENTDIIRWRAPLYMAEFDTANGCLIKESERIIFQLNRNSDGMPNSLGNFHAADISNEKSIVSTGSLWFKLGADNETIEDFYTSTWLSEINFI